MFDIGFWEIMLISIIGLVVLGPQRLPVAIRSVLKWINTAKRMANSVKSEISQELELHEMNEKIIKASKQDFAKVDAELTASLEELKNNVDELTRPYQNNVDDALDAKTSPATHDVESKENNANISDKQQAASPVTTSSQDK